MLMVKTLSSLSVSHTHKYISWVQKFPVIKLENKYAV